MPHCRCKKCLGPPKDAEGTRENADSWFALACAASECAPADSAGDSLKDGQRIAYDFFCNILFFNYL
jgi:hypothetical protein